MIDFLDFIAKTTNVLIFDFFFCNSEHQCVRRHIVREIEITDIVGVNGSNDVIERDHNRENGSHM